MRFSLKRLFLWIGVAACVFMIAGARYRSFAWDDQQLTYYQQVAFSLWCGVIVTTLPLLVGWLVVRTWRHVMQQSDDQ